MEREIMMDTEISLSLMYTLLSLFSGFIDLMVLKNTVDKKTGFCVYGTDFFFYHVDTRAMKNCCLDSLHLSPCVVVTLSSFPENVLLKLIKYIEFSHLTAVAIP